MFGIPAFGMGQNIADASRVQDQRFLDDFSPFTRHVGTGNDLGWDAFFGALQRTGQDAQDAGLKMKMNFGGIGNLAPSLLALTKPQAMSAVTEGYTVRGNDKSGYSRPFGPRALGY